MKLFRCTKLFGHKYPKMVEMFTVCWLEKMARWCLMHNDEAKWQKCHKIQCINAIYVKGNWKNWFIIQTRNNILVRISAFQIRWIDIFWSCVHCSAHKLHLTHPIILSNRRKPFQTMFGIVNVWSQANYLKRKKKMDSKYVYV